MSVIVPAILPTSREDLEEKLLRLHGLVQEVQIDVVDGRFVSPASWPYSGGGRDLAYSIAGGDTLPSLEPFRIEMDLMTTEPEHAAALWIRAGAARVVIHAESTRYLTRTLDELAHTYGHDASFSTDLLSVGLALNVGSELAILEPYIPRIDFVQFMGIAKIGRQGEPFDKRVLAKIQLLRKRYPSLPIQIDGGVTRETAPLLLRAGVSRLVVGSDLWNAKDLRVELHALQALTQLHGIYE